ncbi:unnamed protein product [Parascedosporium putredinis]|uniref:Uncharacterized protein n=1 Tax=Parascedosporium putredinis TaxID=1442378 RepID=A0A9P1HAN0_9PEZI|nr:unnamed protein product [Parascedosporium putredinis]CAI8003060.1 unnamed protein product [Parascedosporium putredinis]
MNTYKLQAFSKNGKAFIAKSTIKTLVGHIQSNYRGKNKADPEAVFLAAIGKIVGSFDYMNDAFTSLAMQVIVSTLRREMGIGEDLFGVRNLRALWSEFEVDAFSHYLSNSQRNFATAGAFALDALLNSKLPNHQLQRLVSQLNQIRDLAYRINFDKYYPKN